MKKITLLVESIKGTKGTKSFENKKEMKSWLKENKNKIKKISLSESSASQFYKKEITKRIEWIEFYLDSMKVSLNKNEKIEEKELLLIFVELKEIFPVINSIEDKIRNVE